MTASATTLAESLTRIGRGGALKMFEEQRGQLEAELRRIYGGTGHLEIVADRSQEWPEEEVARVLAILRTLPDAAGEDEVIKALDIPSSNRWRRSP